MLKCAPHAYAAATQASNQTLSPLLSMRCLEQLTDNSSTLDKAPIRPQKKRCTQAIEARHKQLLSTLSPLEVRAVQ
jgi:hypothetical protein